nr:uncharacterized protein LOC128705221 isoform X1 [Cherax quadricarinatus]
MPIFLNRFNFEEKNKMNLSTNAINSKIFLRNKLLNDVILFSNNYNDLYNKIISKDPNSKEIYKFNKSVFKGLLIETNNFQITPSGSLLYVPTYFSAPSFSWLEFVNFEESTVINSLYRKFLSDEFKITSKILNYAKNLNNTTFILGDEESSNYRYLKNSFVLYSSSKYKNTFHPTMGTNGLMFSIGTAQLATLHWTYVYDITSFNRESNSRDWLRHNTQECAVYKGYKYYYGKTYNDELWECSASGYYTGYCTYKTDWKDYMTKKMYLQMGNFNIFKNNLLNFGNKSMKFVSNVLNEINKFTLLENMEIEIMKRIYEYLDLFQNTSSDILKYTTIKYVETHLKSLDNVDLIGLEYYLAKEFIEDLSSTFRISNQRIINEKTFENNSFTDMLKNNCQKKENDIIIDLFSRQLPKISFKKKNIDKEILKVIENIKNKRIDFSEEFLNSTYNVKKIEDDFRKINLNRLLIEYENNLMIHLEMQIGLIMPIIRNEKLKTFEASQSAANIGWFFGHLFTYGILNSAEKYRIAYDEFWTIDNENDDQFRERKGFLLIDNVFTSLNVKEDLSESDKRIIIIAAILRLCSINKNCNIDPIIKSMLLLMTYNNKIFGSTHIKINRKGLSYNSKINDFNKNIIPQALILMSSMDDKKFIQRLNSITSLHATRLYNIDVSEILSIILPNGYNINTKNNVELEIPSDIKTFMTQIDFSIDSYLKYIKTINPTLFSFNNRDNFENLIRSLIRSQYNFTSFKENSLFWGNDKTEEVDDIKNNSRIILIELNEKTNSIDIVRFLNPINVLEHCSQLNKDIMKRIFSSGFKDAEDLNFCFINQDVLIPSLHIIFKYKFINF